MNFMSKEEFAAYAARLEQATRKGVVPWQSDSDDPEHSFYAVLDRTVVWVFSADKDDLHPYTFTLDRRDDAVGVNDSSLEVLRVESDPAGSAYNEVLESLYSSVKSRVFNLVDFKREALQDVDRLLEDGQ